MTESTTESERLVTRYIELWNEREFSKVSGIAADSVTLTSPTAGTVTGRDEVEAHARAVIDGFPDYRIVVHETLTGVDVVVTESTMTGTRDGEIIGIPPTGEPFEARGMAKFIVADGDRQEERTYFDRHDVLAQLGLVNASANHSVRRPIRSGRAYRSIGLSQGSSQRSVGPTAARAVHVRPRTRPPTGTGCVSAAMPCSSLRSRFRSRSKQTPAPSVAGHHWRLHCAVGAWRCGSPCRR